MSRTGRPGACCYVSHILVLWLASLVLVREAVARQDPARPDSVDRLKISIDMGLVAASGNSSILTLSFGQKVEYLIGRWALRQGSRIVSARADGQETANEYAVYVQPEHRLSEAWRYYVLGSWDRNPFLGVIWRFQEGAGVAWSPVRGPRYYASFEGGFSWFQQKFTSGQSEEFPTVRAQATVRYAFTPRAYLQEIFIYLPNLDANNYRINSELLLVAPIARWLALRVSWVLQFQSAPQPGFGTTDNLYTSGFQLSF